MKNTTIIVNHILRPFTVKVLFKGDKYGLNDCLTHDKDEPLVEFYDFANAGKAFGPLGQFVSRYYASTILGLLRGDVPCGLDLQCDEPVWKIDSAAVRMMCRFVELCMSNRKAVQP